MTLVLLHNTAITLHQWKCQADKKALRVRVDRATAPGERAAAVSVVLQTREAKSCTACKLVRGV